MSDASRAAIEATICSAITQYALMGVAMTAAAQRAAAQIIGAGLVPSSARPADQRQRFNARALQLLSELETAGKPKRAAVGIAARRLAADPHDPAAVATLERQLRRLRQRGDNVQPTTTAMLAEIG